MTRTSRTTRGYSLVELMVAIVIGLLLLDGVIQIFGAGKQGFLMQQGVSRAQENGRIGTFMLSRVVRQAGYYRKPSLSTQDIALLYPPGNTAISGTEGGAGNPDTLVVRFQGHADGANVDCQGIVLDCKGDTTCTADPVVNALVVTNTYSLSAVNATTGVRSLLCSRSIDQVNSFPPVNILTDAIAQPLIEGVTDFQVQYGIDTDADRIADRYVDASSVTNWDTVSAVRITLTTNSVDQIGAGAATGQRITQVYADTVQVRSR